MTLIAAISASTRVLELLANAAVRALVLAGAAGLGLAAFRVKSTTMRLFTWTAVLYAALAMPVLQSMLPPVPVPAPAVFHQGEKFVVAASQSSSTDNVFLPRRRSGQPVSSTAATLSPNVNRTSTPQPETARIVAVPADAPTVLSSFPSSLLSSIPWSTVAAGVYFGVTLLLLARFCVGLAFGRRLAQASQWIDDPRVTSKIASRAQALGLAPAPRVAESELISVPLTLGVLRSTILLPMDWPEWDAAKIDAVVAHEVSHVARRDALTQRLSLLHRAIFWFNPLAWWLDWHLADLAEQASDEAALSWGADRKDYARTLLEFFEALQAAPGRVWWQGVAMAKAGQAEKRLERILSWKGSVAMRLQKSIAVMIVALAVPLIYFVASVHAANQGVPLRSAIGQDQAVPAAPRPEPAPAPESELSSPPEPASQPEFAPAPPAVSGGISGGLPLGVGGGIASPAAPGVAPVGRIGAIAPMAPLPPTPAAGWSGQSSRSGSSSGHGYSLSYGYDDEQRFVIVSGKSDALTMSGSSEDARHVEKLRKTIPGDFIWFQRDEKSYIIRDQATIDRARKLWAPQEEIGKKQEELGKQQEALGKQQEELGAKMERVHVNVPDMTAELDKLKAELKKLSSGATIEQMGEIQSEIGELQSKIGEIQSRAGDQQGKVGELMGALGEKQGKLGEQQGELGRQQAELAQEASRQMKQLLDEAIAKGIAQLEL